MFETPRQQLSVAERLEQLIGSARVGPATPSSPELVAAAKAIVGSLSDMHAPETLRSLRTVPDATNS